MSRLIVIIAGLGFLAFGVVMLVAPIAAFGVVDLVFPDEPLTRIELRAFYGGLELGLGSLLLACALNREHLQAGLWLTAASYGGIGTARLIGVLLEGGFLNGFLIGALIFELGFGIAALVLALRGRQG